MGAIAAGLLGAITGLGGGVVLILLLTIVFKVDIHYAIGTSLISVIATSSGAAAAYFKEGISNIRIGMFLELATTLGAITGAFVVIFMPYLIAVVFGVVLLFTVVSSFIMKHDIPMPATSSKLALRLRLNGSYPTVEGEKKYNVTNVAGGFDMMLIAGIISGLLGIGSGGALKVIAMDNIMRIPFKVSTTTSNFMIGVTAAASAGLYLNRGYIDPGLSFPVVLGVLAGAFIGSKILVKVKTKVLWLVFTVVIAILGVEMIYNGITHQI